MVRRKPIEESGATPVRTYSSDELLARANAWAVRHDYPTLTRATLIELRRDCLIPGPQRESRGEGGGRGARWGWSALAYHRLLKVIRLRALGIIDRDRQRIRLFVGGARLGPSLVRRDLRRILVRDLEKISRDYGTEDLTRAASTPSGLISEVNFLLDPALLERFLATQQNLPDGLADALRQAITDPSMAEFLEQAFRQFVLPDTADTLPQLKKAALRLPGQLSAVVTGELDDLAETMAGLLAHPDSGNAMLEALDQLTDADLVVIRDYALMWPAMCRAVIDLVRSVPYDDLDKSMLIAKELLSRFPRLNAEQGLVLLGLFISRSRARPTFLSAARIALKMRAAAVLRAFSSRQPFDPNPTKAQMEEVLIAAGVDPQNWHLWMEPAPMPETQRAPAG